MIHLDTSVLIAAFTGPKALAPAVRAHISQGGAMSISTLVLYEWRRGPRIDAELQAQEFVCPSTHAVEFGVEEAEIAATLYRHVRRPRSREIDIAIAACAIADGAQLWTLNPEDFADIPGLSLQRK